MSCRPRVTRSWFSSVDRGGKLIELVATPRRRDVVTAFGTTRVGILGVQSTAKPENWRIQHYDFVDSVQLAGSETWYVIARTGGYLKGFVAGTDPPISCPDRSGSPKCPGQWPRSALRPLLNLAAILSISVGLAEPLANSASRWRPSFLLCGGGDSRQGDEREGAAVRL